MNYFIPDKTPKYDSCHGIRKSESITRRSKANMTHVSQSISLAIVGILRESLPTNYQASICGHVIKA